MSKYDSQPKFECQNRSLNVTIRYSARFRMSKSEKRKAKNEKPITKNEKRKEKNKKRKTKYEKRKAKNKSEQTNFTLLLLKCL